MSDEKNAKHDSLVPTGPRGLNTQSTGLARRGLALANATEPLEVSIDLEYCAVLVSRLRELQKSDFNVNDYLRAFDRVKMQEGYILDCVNRTHVYARRVSAVPIMSTTEYDRIFPCDEDPSSPFISYLSTAPFLSHMEFEKSETGFFQAALLCLMLSLYPDIRELDKNSERTMILTLNHFEYLINNPDLKNDLRSRLRVWDIQPKVWISGDSAKVRFACNYPDIGYAYEYVYIRYPNVFEKWDEETVINAPSRIYWY